MKTLTALFAAILIVAGCGDGSGPAQPDKPAKPAEAQTHEQKIRVSLSELGAVSNIEPTEWPQVYEVTLDGQRVYASADGEYMITGDLYRAQGVVNLTELKRSNERRKTLDALSEEDSIVFSPEGDAKHSVWVFTDVDCPYCQRFHEHVEQMNKLGIEVRYLAYPRAGKGSKNWREMQAVWCADDRQMALTQVKSGSELDNAAACDSGAVEAGYSTGRAVGLRGTPMIIDQSGRTLGAYMPPGQLLQRLQAQDASG